MTMTSLFSEFQLKLQGWNKGQSVCMYPRIWISTWCYLKRDPAQESFLPGEEDPSSKELWGMTRGKFCNWWIIPLEECTLPKRRKISFKHLPYPPSPRSFWYSSSQVRTILLCLTSSPLPDLGPGGLRTQEDDRRETYWWEEKDPAPSLTDSD